MGRIEEALKRAGVPGPARDLANSDVARAHGRVPATSDDYPRETSDESVRETIEGYPRERDGRLRDTQDRDVRDVRRRSAMSEQNLAPRSIAAPRTATTTRGGLQCDDSVQGKLVTDSATAASSLEQYRRLAVTLHQMRVERGFKTLMVSSAVPREGKTLTSVNLALTLSESYKSRVLLVDADLRRPSIHGVFRIPNTSGLGEALKSDRAGLQLIEVSPWLTVLPAGQPDRDPTAGLTSDRMRSILAEAAERFDWVIVDTPPVGLISDARLLAALTDGVLLVAGAGQTDYALIQHAVEEIGRDRIIGAVLNRVEADTIAPSEYYNYYYSQSAQS
jgi:protein-tyrosine kinase